MAKAPIQKPVGVIAKSVLLEELAQVCRNREIIKASLMEIEQSRTKALQAFQGAEGQILSILARLGTPS